MLIFEEILKRMKEVLDVKSDRQVSFRVGTTPDNLNHWKKRNSIPIQKLYAFAEEYGLNIGWLLTGEGEKESKKLRKEHESANPFNLTEEEFEEYFARIPIYVDIDDDREQGGHRIAKENVFIPTHFLYTVLGDITEKEDLEAIYLSNNTMEPTIAKDSMVIVDNKKTIPADGKIFVFIYNNELYIKRVIFDIANDKILLRSDNPNFPELVLDGAKGFEGLTVIGQVVGLIGKAA